jgi:GH15 family glucan-1,4-alpha-glucosidase
MTLRHDTQPVHASEPEHLRDADRADRPPPRTVPIEDHGAIGDLHTIGLVAHTGSIDWLCWSRFDAPSIFGRLLDPDGGHWRIAPESATPDCSDQIYVTGTNVLVTRFHLDEALVEVEDLMVIGDDATAVAPDERQLVRTVRCHRGRTTMAVEMAPRPDYGRAEPQLDHGPEGGLALDAGPDGKLSVSAQPGVRWNVTPDRATAQFELAEGDEYRFVLAANGNGELGDRLPERTIRAWQAWTARSTYAGRWREDVERSALALKLLTHGPTGGVIAAATTSLPEVVGGARNWDYRYVWIRDAAFTMYAFLRLGHIHEARAFTGWLLARLGECRPEEQDAPLSPLYDLDGSTELPEVELDHWKGYADSRPVRVGNAAANQKQLDIYGEIIDSLYLTDKHDDGLSLAAWDTIVHLVDWVIDHWDEPDEGIWEPRSGRQRYTSSLLMSWVAVERAMRMAIHRGRPAPLEHWRAARDEMHATLVERGWNEELGAFTQTLDGDTLDAAILLAPLVKFVPASDPTWRSTLDAIDDQLAHGPFVDRYDPTVTSDGDGLPGDEGSFTICSFWFVEALARSGDVNAAHLRFERLLSYAGPLGLFAEQISADGRQLGNFPQAFTHLALISAAFQLDEDLR